MAAAAVPIGEWIGSFFVADTAAAGAGAAAAGAGAASAGTAGAAAAAAGGADAAAVGAGAAGAAGVAASGALPEVLVTASPLTGAAAAGGAGTLGGAGAAVAGGAGGAAGAAAGAGGGSPTPGYRGPGKILTTISEAAAVAQGASSLYTLAQGPGNVSVPPSPYTANVDQGALSAEEQERQRLAAAGGIQSTIGTGGGQAGAVLNPATISSRTLLGG